MKTITGLPVMKTTTGSQITVTGNEGRKVTCNANHRGVAGKHGESNTENGCPNGMVNDARSGTAPS